LGAALFPIEIGTLSPIISLKHANPLLWRELMFAIDVLVNNGWGECTKNGDCP